MSGDGGIMFGLDRHATPNHDGPCCEECRNLAAIVAEHAPDPSEEWKPVLEFCCCLGAAAHAAQGPGP